MKRSRGGLVFKARRLLYHSTLGLRVMKKRNRPGQQQHRRRRSVPRGSSRRCALSASRRAPGSAARIVRFSVNTFVMQHRLDCLLFMFRCIALTFSMRVVSESQTALSASRRAPESAKGSEEGSYFRRIDVCFTRL